MRKWYHVKPTDRSKSQCQITVGETFRSGEQDYAEKRGDGNEAQNLEREDSPAAMTSDVSSRGHILLSSLEFEAENVFVY
jgi:hypothetical protein